MRALYPDKPIYDVPGVPVCTGRELTANLLRQVSPFTGTAHSHLHLDELVETIAPAPADSGFRFFGIYPKGLQFRTRLIVIAAGAGAFVPKGMTIAGLESCLRVHYHLPSQDARKLPPWAGQHVLIAGGGEPWVRCCNWRKTPSQTSHHRASA